MTTPINLYSDTQTRPCAAMRKVIAEAEVGDELSFADPSINRLNQMVAKLLGKEKAIFCPSGTMCNLIALLAHGTSGDLFLCERRSHIYQYENGGFAALAGRGVLPIDGNEKGHFSISDIASAVENTRLGPLVSMVSLEQTCMEAGGTIWSLRDMQEIGDYCRSRGIIAHLDGARLINAVVASGHSASEHAAAFDSVWIDFSKGLGAPVGACLAGSEEFIKKAWHYKIMLGGGMRQAGVVAAAAEFALNERVERLAEDHQNARLLAEGLLGIEGLKVEHPETNLVYVELTQEAKQGAADMVKGLKLRGLLLVAMSDVRLRMVTHLDVSREQVLKAVEIIKEYIADL